MKEGSLFLLGVISDSLLKPSPWCTLSYRFQIKDGLFSWNRYWQLPWTLPAFVVNNNWPKAAIGQDSTILSCTGQVAINIVWPVRYVIRSKFWYKLDISEFQMFCTTLKMRFNVPIRDIKMIFTKEITIGSREQRYTNIFITQDIDV